MPVLLATKPHAALAVTHPANVPLLHDPSDATRTVPEPTLWMEPLMDDSGNELDEEDLRILGAAVSTQ
jgi:hypothetical protein